MEQEIVGNKVFLYLDIELGLGTQMSYAPLIFHDW